MEFLISKLDARITGARELKSMLDRLNATMPRVHILINKAEWWRFKDENVAHLLMQLRDAAYDAEDVIAEFKYYELQQQIEGKASKFLHSLVSVVKDAISNSATKVRDIQARLDFAITEFEKTIGLLGISDGPTPVIPRGKAVQRETSSFMIESVLGREKEVEMILELMQVCNSDGPNSKSGACDSSSSGVKRRKTASNPFILPIVGIGGVGKTALAQRIYNDERVKIHFDLKIWVCVSDQFYLKEITKEIIESANRELVEKGEFMSNERQFGILDNLTNLDSLQKMLKGKVESRRYLLVLDDVWSDNSRDLESLFNPLTFGLPGSMILLTTRLQKVAEIAGNMDHIELQGLPDDVYWDLFKKYAFGSLDPNSFPELVRIGKKIAARLKGSPLAAKTIGGILHVNLNIDQWRSILNSELWKIKQDDGGILSALRVSYQFLPMHLKRCFIICSLFPKDYPLYLNDLGPIWMADGITIPDNNPFLEDFRGQEYFIDLKGRSFFIRGQYNAYHVHDLMHDLAKSLSSDMCYCQEDDTWRLESYNGVRHLSVYRKPIELFKKEIARCNKLRSLLFLNTFPNEIKLAPLTLRYLFDELPYLRVLDLGHCKVEQLPENIGKLKLLFSININTTRIKSLPESICQLYNLEVLNVERCPLESFPKCFHNLTNLRLISHTMEISSLIPRIGKLTSLVKLREFKVLNENGHRIQELKNMTQLRDRIKISKLEDVEGGEEAAGACLNNKEYLTNLTLSWSVHRKNRFWNSGTVIDEDTIQGFEPHPKLECLYIENYAGRAPASWLLTKKLPCLLELGLRGCSNLESLEDWLEPHQLPSLERLEIEGCIKLHSLPLEWMVMSSLSRLEIINCPQISCSSNLILPSSLSSLHLDSCGELDKSLPGCLKRLYSLKSLELNNCQHVTSLQSEANHPLKYLKLSNCAELQCLKLSNPSTLEVLKIENCAKLIQLNPSVSEIEIERIQQLHKLHIDNTSLLKLPFLSNPPHLLVQMKISDSSEENMFIGDLKVWLNGLELLEKLIFNDCSNLTSLPEELNSVRRIEIRNCMKIQSLPDQLPPWLNIRCLGTCNPYLIEQVKQKNKAVMKDKKIMT